MSVGASRIPIGVSTNTSTRLKVQVTVLSLSLTVYRFGTPSSSKCWVFSDSPFVDLHERRVMRVRVWPGTHYKYSVNHCRHGFLSSFQRCSAAIQARRLGPEPQICSTHDDIHSCTPLCWNHQFKGLPLIPKTIFTTNLIGNISHRKMNSRLALLSVSSLSRLEMYAVDGIMRESFRWDIPHWVGLHYPTNKIAQYDYTEKFC